MADTFSKGRDFGAWLGLVPKQMSTGEAAWVVLVKIKPEGWERYGLKSWIETAKQRLHRNVLAIALANKLARIAWAVLHKGRAFECVTNATASRPA